MGKGRYLRISAVRFSFQFPAFPCTRFAVHTGLFSSHALRKCLRE